MSFATKKASPTCGAGKKVNCKQEIEMSNTAILITDMSILVGIFLLGLLAKLFPKRGNDADSKR